MIYKYTIVTEEDKRLPLPDRLLNTPVDVSMQGWKGVGIEEIGHQLVSLSELSDNSRIIISPQYFLQGIPGSSPNIYLREEAAERLFQAGNRLPNDLSLIVFDGFRPIEVQTSLFGNLKQRVLDENPRITDQEASRKTELYVSTPSSDPKKPSPHFTGGAIDLSIIENGGHELSMGTPWDSFDSESATSFFKDADSDIHYNRRLLYTIMTEAGFTNYPEEWWHYDFGNQFWAHITKTKAIYGAVVPEGGES